ncbi:MAG: peroxiredoxin-like family protein [Pyrinomonadaceae bacterium]
MLKKLFILSVVLLSAMAVAAQMEMEKGDGMKKTVTAEEASKMALNVGAKMPSFNLSDPNGNFVSSEDLLKQGNLVVVFYRGAWCPFCNAYLHKLQMNLKEIEASGGKLVAISVENPDTSMSVAEKNKLEFTVLSDKHLDLARKFGIVYQLSPETNEKYKGYGIDLVKQNGTETPDLPLSATYIVKQNGEIAYAYLEPDYKQRLEPEIIIETLGKLKKSDGMMKSEGDKMMKSKDDKMKPKDEKMKKTKDDKMDN